MRCCPKQTEISKATVKLIKKTSWGIFGMRELLDYASNYLKVVIPLLEGENLRAMVAYSGNQIDKGQRG